MLQVTRLSSSNYKLQNLKNRIGCSMRVADYCFISIRLSFLSLSENAVLRRGRLITATRAALKHCARYSPVARCAISECYAGFEDGYLVVSVLLVVGLRTIGNGDDVVCKAFSHFVHRFALSDNACVEINPAGFVVEET